MPGILPEWPLEGSFRGLMIEGTISIDRKRAVTQKKRISIQEDEVTDQHLVLGL